MEIAASYSPRLAYHTFISSIVMIPSCKSLLEIPPKPSSVHIRCFGNTTPADSCQNQRLRKIQYEHKGLLIFFCCIDEYFSEAKYRNLVANQKVGNHSRFWLFFVNGESPSRDRSLLNHRKGGGVFTHQKMLRRGWNYS